MVSMYCGAAQSVAAPRDGPSGQPHPAALALPPTVPSASSTSCAYLQMMASVTAHLCRGKSHF